MKPSITNCYSYGQNTTLGEYIIIEQSGRLSQKGEVMLTRNQIVNLAKMFNMVQSHPSEDKGVVKMPITKKEIKKALK